MISSITANISLFQDTCNVYILRSGEDAVLVDFGSGAVLDHLAELGVKRILAVLMTHYHRDQGQGLPRLAGSGTPIWAPYAEQELFQNVDEHWQGLPLANNYNVSQDRFALLEPVPLAGTLRDYAHLALGPYDFAVLPTPGHTPGSLSLMVECDGQRLIFTGDLISGPGKVWSLASLQWSYNGAEGAAASVASLLDLKRRSPDQLLPSHGDPISDPAPAIDLLVSRLRQLLQQRMENPRLPGLIDRPYIVLTPHLLRNRSSDANSYVLLSETGKALFIDYGYDFMTGAAAYTSRASRRPWLYTLTALKQQFGVSKIDVVIPTHYHDDHVAGINLLREVEGARVWAADNFAHILENPASYDLPCLWYDPIPVDRRLPLGKPIQWEEYVLQVYPLPGHARRAVAIAFQVDDRRVLATGDQYQGDSGQKWNYVYRNHFQPGDYLNSARLYQELQPDLILPGHWEPMWVKPGYFEMILQQGETLEAMHRELLPLETAEHGGEGYLARIYPYYRNGYAGERMEFELTLDNPYPWEINAQAQIIAPAGWKIEENPLHLRLKASSQNESQAAKFHVIPTGPPAERYRIAADIVIGDKHWGQQGEALVTLLADRRRPIVSRPQPLQPFPVLDQDFPDPDIIRLPDSTGSPTGFTYYAYATNSRGLNVRLARSNDLLEWQVLSDALPELPRWAMRGGRWTWSPDVIATNGRYLMYYVTRLADGGRGVQAIGLADSRRPEGPFCPDERRPLVCQVSEGGSIDPSAFEDEDGKRYLIWKNDGNSCGRRAWIYLQRLSEDGRSLVGQPTRLLTADQHWEGYVVEGPVLWKNDGLYYLFYAANDYVSTRYAIGYAVAEQISGPYRKPGKPFLSSNPEGGLTGPGGPDITITPQGNTCLVFHAWAPERYRNMHLARLSWKDSRPFLSNLRDDYE